MRPIDRFFHPVLAADALGERPRRVQVGDDAFVLFRPRAGEVACLPDRCPHRHAPLSAGRVRPDGAIECPYHGWSFAADGHGSCPAQPRRRVAVAPMQAREHRGWIWIGGPDAVAPDPLRWSGFHFAGAYALEFAAPLEVVLDLFSEAEHFAYVHHRLGWDSDELERLHHEVDLDDRSLRVRYRGRQRDTWLRPLMFVRAGDEFENHLSITFEPVRIVYDSFWRAPASDRRRPVHSRLATYFVPRGPGSCTLTFFHSLRITSRWLALARPLVARALLALSRREFAEDAAFAPKIAGTGASFATMQLGKYDRALVHNRRLLRALYHGEPERRRLALAR